MARRWIMVELGEHCHSHVIPRLKKVIDGEDPAGVTAAMSWKGGGGFRYYRLAPSLIVNDRWGNPVINPEYNAAQLAEALAKLEGFAYAPSETHWWQHGHSSERDFIYVTTQNLPLSSCWRCPMKSARSGAAGVLRRFSTESRRPERQSAGRN